MDVALRRIEPEPPRIAARPERRRDGGRAFTLDRGDGDGDGELDPERDNSSPEERQVAPRPDDEAGSHLDLTA